MLHLVASTVLVFAVLQSAQAEETYPYALPMTQFYAQVTSNLAERVNARIEALEKTMVEHNMFSKVANQYNDVIEKAKRSVNRAICHTTSEIGKLKELNATFDSSLQECRSQANCKTDLAETTAKIVTTIQGFDADAFIDISACTDDACKLKVYDSTQDKLFELYQESLPALSVTADQAVSNDQCYSSIVQCMLEKNSDSMKQMYARISSLEKCLTTGGTRLGKISSILGSVTGSRPTGGWFN